MEEIWVKTFYFSNNYMVSNIGRLKSIPRTVCYKRIDGGYRTLPIIERIIPPRINKDGYYIYNLYNGKEKKTITAHRLVMTSFYQFSDTALVINHIDANKLNNNLENLEWCTIKENVNHSIKMGLRSHLVGEKSPNHKLKECDVLRILELYSNNHTQLEIANIFGLSQSYVGSIVNNKSWKYLTKNLNFN